VACDNCYQNKCRCPNASCPMHLQLVLLKGSSRFEGIPHCLIVWQESHFPVRNAVFAILPDQHQPLSPIFVTLMRQPLQALSRRGSAFPIDGAPPSQALQPPPRICCRRTFPQNLSPAPARRCLRVCGSSPTKRSRSSPTESPSLSQPPSLHNSLNVAAP